MSAPVTSSPVLHHQPDTDALVAAGEDQTCTDCDGEGVVTVVTNDPFDGAVDGLDCTWCGGTGRAGAA